MKTMPPTFGKLLNFTLIHTMECDLLDLNAIDNTSCASLYIARDKRVTSCQTVNLIIFLFWLNTVTGYIGSVFVAPTTKLTRGPSPERSPE